MEKNKIDIHDSIKKLSWKLPYGLAYKEPSLAPSLITQYG